MQKKINDWFTIVLFFTDIKNTPKIHLWNFGNQALQFAIKTGNEICTVILDRYVRQGMQCIL